MTHDTMNDSVSGYEALERVLKLARDQSARGKGKERHANDLPFEDQPIMMLGRLYGVGFNAGQVSKKLQEAQGMASRGEHDRAKTEALGAIVYAASAYLLFEEADAQADYKAREETALSQYATWTDRADWDAVAPRSATPDSEVTVISKYRPLKEGELVQPGDEVLTDERTGWRPARGSVGSYAPDPLYPAHRVFRRRIDKGEDQ